MVRNPILYSESRVKSWLGDQANLTEMFVVALGPPK